MNTVRALVVGVSKYSMPAVWNNKVPIRNACAIALWLRNAGVRAEDIHLFVEKQELHSDQLAIEATDLGKAGIEVKGAPAFDTINDYSRTIFAKDVLPTDRIFVFWSGHGVTDGQQRRLFFCRDYDNNNLKDKVFNASAFLTRMKDAPFNVAAGQLLLADVCGTYSRVATDPRDYAAQNIREVRQLSIFASPDGIPTRWREDGRGEFTSILLEALGEQGKVWPDEEMLLKSLRKRAEGSDSQPYSISHYRKGGEATIGAGRRTDGSQAIADSIWEVFSRYEIAPDLVEPHYLRTAARVGQSRLAQVRSIRSMLAALAEHDSTNDGFASSWLVEFLKRIAADNRVDQALNADIRTWLLINSLPPNRAEVDTLLRREHTEYRLVLRIDDAQGRLSRLHAYLRYANYFEVDGFEVQVYPVVDRKELEVAVCDVITKKLTVEQRENLRIHFVVDPPLFDLPFHDLKAPDGEPLGDAFICSVHYRSRAVNNNGALAASWQRWLEKLHALDAEITPLLEFPAGGVPLPNGTGIFYASFPIGALGNSAEQAKVVKALRLGVAYLCWPTDALSNPPPDIKSKMIEFIAKARADLAQVPREIFDARLISCEVACKLNVLWDDPLFKPFTGTRGVQR